MKWLLLILGSALLSPAANAVRESYPYPKSKRVMINSQALAQCMATLIAKEGNRFSLEPQFMYPNNFRKKGYRKYCEFSQNRFFHYLIVDTARECDYESGREADLKKWVLDQADNSIDPLGIFEESLRLNNGHAFNALLTLHQLLRNEARWFSKKYYLYESTEEKADAFWAKFVDIRGDLAELGPGKEGDHRGSWYRFWGIMMYRLTLTEMGRVEAAGGSCHMTTPGIIPSAVADLKSSSTALLAELGKYLFDFLDADYKAGGDRAGKARINSAGSQTASYLIDAIDPSAQLNATGTNCLSDKILIDSIL